MFFLNPFMPTEVELFTSIAGQATATASGTEATVPTTQAGDIIFTSDIHVDTETEVTVSGWTTWASDTNSGYRTVEAYKVADGTEGGTSNTFSTSNPYAQRIFLLRLNKAVTSATPQDVNAVYTNGNPSNQVKNVGSYSRPCAVIGVYSANGDTTFTRTFSGATADGELDASNRFMKFKLFEVDETPVDVTIDMGDRGNYNFLGSVILELT